jgi:hypothetical protein
MAVDGVSNGDAKEQAAEGEEAPTTLGGKIMLRLHINPNLMMLKVTLFLLYGGHYTQINFLLFGSLLLQQQQLPPRAFLARPRLTLIMHAVAILCSCGLAAAVPDHPHAEHRADSRGNLHHLSRAPIYHFLEPALDR